MGYHQVKSNSFFSRLDTFQSRSLLRLLEFYISIKKTAIDEFGDKENNFSTLSFKFFFYLEKYSLVANGNSSKSYRLTVSQSLSLSLRFSDIILIGVINW